MQPLSVSWYGCGTEPRHHSKDASEKIGLVSGLEKSMTLRVTMCNVGFYASSSIAVDVGVLVFSVP